MFTIIDIKKKKKSVSLIFDTGECIDIPVFVAAKNNLFIGQPFTEEELEELQYSAHWEDGLQYAYRILSRRSYSCKMMTTKLKARKLPADICGDLVNHLKNEGYLDDQKWMITNIEYYQQHKRYGSIFIRHKLFEKGLNGKLIDAYYESHSVEIQEYDQENLQFWIAKKWKKQTEPDHKEKSKLYRFLLGKGFSYELISDAMY